MPSNTATWRFPRPFWMANIAELFERSAYYGVFIGLAVYLTRSYGFSDVQAGWLGAYFSSFIYLLPMFAGAWADRMGFRAALMLAFGLLAVGYTLFGIFGIPEMQAISGMPMARAAAVAALTSVLLGGAFVKPIITGSVAKYSDAGNRARAFSIYYQVVNIGAFLGKTFAHPLRIHLGLQYISFYSALMAIFGLLVVALFYKGSATVGEHKSVRQIFKDFGTVLRNTRFMILIVIVAGFWVIQGQLYASMPKYVLRTVGSQANPEWLANINPFVVVIFVVPITHLVRKLRPVTSIGISLLLIPLSALMMSLSPVLQSRAGTSIGILGIAFHPVTIMLIVGISLQGLAECFLSPRYLEFASKQAPPGQEGLYMGYSHLNTFLAWLLGFGASGYLLEAYCPNPTTLDAAQRQAYEHALATGGNLPEAYAHAHYIWYIYAAVGLASFAALLVFRWITDRIDSRRKGGTTDETTSPQNSGEADRSAADISQGSEDPLSSPDKRVPSLTRRPDPLGINPAILHIVVLAKILVFVLFLAIVEGNHAMLLSPSSTYFYVLVYLLLAIAADAAALTAARSRRPTLAVGILRPAGWLTFPLGLFLLVSARLVRESAKQDGSAKDGPGAFDS